MRNILIILSLFFMLQNFCVLAETDYTISRFKAIDGLSSNCITVLFQDSKGFIWIGTEDGLNRYDGKEFRTFITDYVDDSLISGNQIVTISEDSEGNIWVEDKKASFTKINAEKGIYIHYLRGFNDENLENIPVLPVSELNINPLIHEKIKQANINISEEITSIIEDRSGIIWVGTRYNGLIKIWKIFPHFNAIDEINKKMNLSSYNVTSIFTKNDKEIWIGTGEKGLYFINIETGVVKNFTLDAKKNKNNNDIVHSLYNEDNILFICSNSGIYTLDIITHTIKKLDENLSDDVYDIVKDKMGIFWIATNEGLYRYDRSKVDIFVNLKNGIYKLFENTEQDLWMGNAEGLKYFNKDRNYLIIPSGVETFEAHSLSDGGKGDLFIGTCSGLFRLVKDSLKYHLVQVKEFPSRSVSSAILDNKEQVWITSGNGITLIDNLKIVRKNINLYDGFEGSEFNRNAIFKSPSGQIYFGSRGGLYWIDPNSIEYNSNIPEVVLTNIEMCVKDKCTPVYLDELNIINIHHQFGMSLNISFAAMEFTQPSKNKYKVFVQNYDSEWRQESYLNNISLTNIRPGKYILHITSSNSDYNWNTKIFEIPIHIKAPLWRTWMFYIFYVLMFALIIQLIVSIRIRYYKNLNKSLIVKSQDQSVLEAQKEELTRINRNLIDSINYATRIQSAVIPAEQKIRRLFPQSFVYFNPRDNVSGDFYWVSEVGSKVFLSAVDCTGHGVPGAFLSIIGMNLLRSIIEVQKEDDPARILEKLSLELEKTFGNEDSEDTIKDGMDMAICVIDRDNFTMKYAGAVNDLYMVRDSELVVYKGDRSPVGHSVDGIVPQYTSNVIEVCENDIFFIFSDGYADQFGGPELKKFKYRRFRHMLLNIHHLPPDDQKNALNQAFEEWKGANNQVDDVLVMGFCPKTINNH